MTNKLVSVIHLDDPSDDKPFYLHSKQRKMSHSAVSVTEGGTITIPDGETIVIGDDPVTHEMSYHSYTGHDTGGIISINADDTLIDITAGSGYIIDNSIPDKKVVTKIEWDDMIGVSVTYLNTASGTFIGIDANGDLVQQIEDFYPGQTHTLRETIRLGRLGHFDKTVVSQVFNYPYHFLSTDIDYACCNILQGTVSAKGCVISNNGANLKLDFSEWIARRIGANYETDPNNPNTPVVPGVSQFTFFPAHTDGTGYTTLGALTSDIDPTFWDDGSSTLQPVGVNDYTIQEVVFFPNNITYTSFIIYGQELYSNLGQAEEALFTYRAEINDDIKGGSSRALIMIRGGATDLDVEIAAGRCFIKEISTGGVIGGGVNYLDRIGTQLQPKTITDNIYTEGYFNTTTSFQFNGTDINTTGTLSNIAYKAQDNTFSVIQTYASHPSFTLDTELIDKKYADDSFEPVLTKGNLTESTSSVLQILGGTGSVIGAGTSIEVDQATSTNDGYLSSEDWIIFNNKQDALSFPIAQNLGGTGIDSSSATDGQLLIGGTVSNDLQLATLTAGTNVSIVNAGNSITISSSGADTFAGLTDVTGAYTTPFALYAVNTSNDGLEEKTTLLTEPLANQFQLSRGTTNLFVSSSCDIDQNISTVSFPTFDDVTLTSLNRNIASLLYDFRSPGGITDMDESTMSFTDGTRTFDISPVGSTFSYYIRGVYYEVSATDSVVITDQEGIHAIYYDDGILKSLYDPSSAQFDLIILDNAIVAYVMWNATDNEGKLFEERHGITMSPESHLHFHLSIGTQYVSGLALAYFSLDGTGDLDSHAQFSIQTGVIRDEDIELTTNTLASTVGAEVWYLSGSNWRWETNTGFSVLTTGTGRLAWNDGGTLVEVTNNNFVLCHIWAINAYDRNPISIMGQEEYNTINSARQGAEIEINNLILSGLPSPELKPIASIIFQTSNGYVNSVKARVRTTDTGDSYVDWRQSNLSPSSPAANHGSLSGLGNDDHFQYLLLTGRSGGQIVYGGLDASDDITFHTTLDTTKGHYIFPDITDGIVKVSTGILSGGNSVSLTTEVTGILPLDNGGTGIDSSAVTDGQLLIGGTAGNDFDLATITAGTGISIVNGTNSITISSAGGSGYWQRIGTILSPINSGDDVELGTGYLEAEDVIADNFYVGSNLLTVGSSPDEFIVGSYHAAYSTITSALAAQSGAKLYRLLPETYSEDITFNNEPGARMVGELSTVNGNIQLASSSSIDLYNVTSSGVHGVLSVSGIGYFKALKINSGTVTSGMLFSSDTSDTLISEVGSANIDSNVFIGTASPTAIGNVISYNSYSELFSTTGDASYVRTSATGRYSAIANRSLATSSAGNTINFINLNGDADVCVIANDVMTYDKIINQSNGSIFLLGNYLDGDITISAGQSYIDATYITGDITSTAASNITSYVGIPYLDGVVSRSSPSGLIGIVGKAGDEGIQAYTGSGYFKVMGRGLTTSGGGIEFDGDSGGNYSSWFADRSSQDLRIYCNVDSSNYEFRVYNSYTGRSSKIYNDALASSNGTVYANSGYLTRTNPSDETLKDNFNVVDTNGVSDKLALLTIMKYNWKINGTEGMSVTAQKFQEQFPDAIESADMPSYIDENGKTIFEEKLGYNDRWMWYHLAGTIDLINRVKVLETKLAEVTK